MSDALRRSRFTTQAQAGAALLEFLDTRVAALVEQLLRERGDDAGDPLIRSDRLGPNNRIVLGLIKRGEIRGVLLGNRWHVRRSEWARYIAKLEAEQEAERAEAGEATTESETDVDTEADRILADLGLERRPATPATRTARAAIDARPSRSRERRPKRAR